MVRLTTAEFVLGLFVIFLAVVAISLVTCLFALQQIPI